MAGLKSISWNRKQLIPALLVITILYQLTYNIILYNAVQRDAGLEECSAMPGVGNADSPHCQEVRLFRTWYDTAEVSDGEEAADLLASSEPVDVIGNRPHSSITVLVANHTTHIGEQLDEEKEKRDLELKRAMERTIEHNARVQQRQALMEKLEKQISASLNASSYVTPWGKDLMTLQHHLEEEMHAHDAVHERKERWKRLESAVKTSLDSSSDTPWAKDLKELHEHLENETVSHQALHEAVQARHARHLAMKANMTSEIAERMTHLENNLKHLVSERSEWEAQLLSKYTVPTKTRTIAPTGFLEKRLQWSSVSAWSKSSWKSKPSWAISGKPSIQFRRELRHMHWSGDIPSVTCVTAIRSSHHTKARMMYFVNNFRLQDYKGSRQLVFVYHQSDTDAAELVKKYAESGFIRGVAHHGENVFPSSVALRYAAWSSNASVIARWDFEEWHDPSRLSMQVAALARASRPACILRPQLDATSDDYQNTTDATSLVGERSWMEMHWVPHTKEELTKLTTAQGAEMVELDMQHELPSSNTSHIEHNLVPGETAHVYPGETAQKEHSTHHTSAAHSWSMSECLAFDNSNHSTDHESHLEERISEKFGPDMPKEFHTLMVRHHDITQKLQLLCLQSVLENDPQKQIFLWQHVDTMAGVRIELDKHIASMRSTFEEDA